MVPLSSLITPLFICEGCGVTDPLKSIDGQYARSLDCVDEHVRSLIDKGLNSFALLPLSAKRSRNGDIAFEQSALMPQVLSKLSMSFPKSIFIPDLCLCPYMASGHCGLEAQGVIDNDSTIQALITMGLRYAESGATILMPSAMIDGLIGALRSALDSKGFRSISIMSQSAKVASAFYGPVREASAGGERDLSKTSYQVHPANRSQMIREMKFDMEEGADIIMVKPALSYLDIISEASALGIRKLAAFSTSAEYLMLRAGESAGLWNALDAARELICSLNRAGAETVLTYFAEDLAASNNQRD